MRCRRERFRCSQVSSVLCFMNREVCVGCFRPLFTPSSSHTRFAGPVLTLARACEGHVFHGRAHHTLYVQGMLVYTQMYALNTAVRSGAVRVRVREFLGVWLGCLFSHLRLIRSLSGKQTSSVVEQCFSSRRQTPISHHRS